MTLNIKKTICLTIIIVSLLTIIGTISYAFFTAVNDVTEQNVTLNSAAIRLVFSDRDSGINKKLALNESVTKRFTIENKGTLDVVAKIRWLDLINTYTKGSLTYTLSYSENATGVYTEIVSKTDIPQLTKPGKKVLAKDLTIPAGKTYYYNLVITFNNLSDVDQNADLNATLSTKFELVENSAPDSLLDVILAKVNDSSITTYNDGDKGEMYTFTHNNLITTTTDSDGTYTHSATQVANWTEEELVDYRYIGTSPNNWVKFNNEDWRIIGVFTVEKSDGTKEKLVKIIRNESIGNLTWNSANINEWPGGSLYTLLNSGDYYNRANTYVSTGLSDDAKSQVEEVKWYLGGTRPSGLLNGPSYYNFERGTNTYNASRSKNTLAKVGLMYPSDYIFTYANGVNDTCFRVGMDCRARSWLRSDDYHEWTISPRASNARRAFYISWSGSVDANMEASNTYIVRPTVYLQSGVQIVSGKGTISEPYILSF